MFEKNLVRSCPGGCEKFWLAREDDWVWNKWREETEATRRLAFYLENSRKISVSVGLFPC